MRDEGEGMNKNALANVKRHDYAPFGEELFNGARTTAMGYGVAPDSTRQKFGSKMVCRFMTACEPRRLIC